MTGKLKRPRGRPRPQETIERDNKILKYLRENGARTRNDLAEVLGEERSKVWLALDRLRSQGLVRMCASASPGPDMLWTAEVDTPCP
jgi:uncharacterized membrane protein